MITEQELEKAKKIVKTIMLENNDPVKAMQTISDMCEKDVELRTLFAKVGLSLYEASIAVKH